MTADQRSHVERMLARAKRRRAQADRLVTKWSKCLDEIDRHATAQRQPQLWDEAATKPAPDGHPAPGLEV